MSPQRGKVLERGQDRGQYGARRREIPRADPGDRGAPNLAARIESDGRRTVARARPVRDGAAGKRGPRDAATGHRHVGVGRGAVNPPGREVERPRRREPEHLRCRERDARKRDVGPTPAVETAPGVAAFVTVIV